MKTLKLIAQALVVVLSISTAFAQVEYAYNSDESVTVKTIESKKMMVPSFKGGDEALAEYMEENLNYPELAKRQGVEGTVILKYTITKTGEIRDIEVVQSVSEEIDKEAIRLVSKMPAWTPAVKSGKVSEIKYQLPVTFQLNF